MGGGLSGWLPGRSIIATVKGQPLFQMPRVAVILARA